MKIIYTKAITKDVQKIKDKKLILKIEQLISDLKNASAIEEIKSIKKLSGHPYAYRARVGNYRLGFFYQNQRITLIRFLKRNDIDKLFP